MSLIEIKQLWIYPVKSCAGIQVDELLLDEHGPRWDRQWMIVDEKGLFISQRQFPKLAQIKTALDENFLILRWQQEGVPQELRLSLDLESAATCAVKVWGSELMAHAESESANQKLSQFLGQSVTLVRHGSQSQRRVELRGATAESWVRFADGFPLLLTNEQSLRALNHALTARGELAVPMTRFRSNIVIDCGQAYDEDTWTRCLSPGGDITLEFAKPCARCVMITVDQESGLKVSPAPTAELARSRKGSDLEKSLPERNYKANGVYFGMNLVIHALRPGAHRIQVGDQFSCQI